MGYKNMTIASKQKRGTCVVVSKGSLVSLEGRDDTMFGGEVAVTDVNARAPFVIARDCSVEVKAPNEKTIYCYKKSLSVS